MKAIKALILLISLSLALVPSAYPQASSDLEWESHSHTVNGTGTGIVWSGVVGIFVASLASCDVDSECIITSPDGEVWTDQTHPSTTNGFTTIDWSDDLDLFLAGGVGGEIQTSPDGENWTTQTTPNSLRRDGAAYSTDLGLWVVVSSDSGTNSVITSPDAENWTERTTPSGDEYSAVTWSPSLGLFVAVGRDSSVATSSNGVNWEQRSAPNDRLYQAVVWSDREEIFVAAGSDASAPRESLMTSTDGINWVEGDFGVDNRVQGMAWSSELGLFLTTSVSQNRIMSSSDGFSWEEETTDPANAGYRAVGWSPDLLTFSVVANSDDLFFTGNNPNFRFIEITSAPSSVQTIELFDVSTQVTNETGVGVPNRTVGLVTDPSTFIETAETNDAGFANFTDLQITLAGQYEVIATEQGGGFDSVSLTVTSPSAGPGRDAEALGVNFPELAEKSQMQVSFLQFFAFIVLFISISAFTFRATGNSITTLALSVPITVLMGITMGILPVWIMQLIVLVAGAIWVYLSGRGTGGTDPVKIIIVWVIYFTFSSLLIGSGLADVPTVPEFERPTGNFLDGLGLGGLNVLLQIINILWGGIVFLFNIFTFNIGGPPGFIRVLVTGLTTPPLFWSIAKLIRGLA